jgi:hypothetical protein
MNVIAMIICGLFLAAVWRVKVPDDLNQLADNDQSILQRRERELVVAAAPGGGSWPLEPVDESWGARIVRQHSYAADRSQGTSG